MKNNQKANYEARANILKAMAHPTRLLIIEELNKEERCVRELTEMVGVDISTISKHLKILKSVGIVSDEKRANCVYYTLKTPCILKFIGCIELVLKSNLENKILSLSK